MGWGTIGKEGHVFEMQPEVGDDWGFAFFKKISSFLYGVRGEGR